MKPAIYYFLFICISFCTACSKDDSNEKLKMQYEKDIVGVWEPNYDVRDIYYYYEFKEDRTGTEYMYSYFGNIFYLETTRKFSNWYIELDLDATPNYYPPGIDKLHIVKFTYDEYNNDNLFAFISVSPSIINTPFGTYSRIDKVPESKIE